MTRPINSAANLITSSSIQPTATSYTVISRSNGWRAVDLPELFRFRELLLILALRDIKVRYKQTLLGALWAVVQPMAQMVVFTAFFASRGLSTDGLPAPLFYLAGLVPWQFFAGALAGISNSVVENQNLITKVYFPRLVIPIAAVGSSLIDFAISFSVLLIFMAFYGTLPGVGILLIPVFLLLAIAAALAVGIWLSAFNVEFRDVRYIIPFLIQFWLFLTPIIYPSSSVTGFKRTLLAFNPMTGVVDGFRYCLFGKPAPDSTLLVSAASILVLLAGGLIYFRRMESTFADTF